MKLEMNHPGDLGDRNVFRWVGKDPSPIPKRRIGVAGKGYYLFCLGAVQGNDCFSADKRDVLLLA